MIFYGKWVGYKYTVRPMDHLDHQQKQQKPPRSPDHSVSTTAGFQIRSLFQGGHTVTSDKYRVITCYGAPI